MNHGFRAKAGDQGGVLVESLDYDYYPGIHISKREVWTEEGFRTLWNFIERWGQSGHSVVDIIYDLFPELKGKFEAFILQRVKENIVAAGGGGS